MVMDHKQSHESLIGIAGTITLEEVNFSGAHVLEYISDFGKASAPVPAAIIACVPKKHVVIPVPTPGKGEILLKIEAASINPIDWNDWIILALPHAFLIDLNHRRSRLDNLTVRICGPKQDAKVDVSYFYPGNDRLGHASGFYGPKWTNFCFENEVSSGQQLLFINHRNSNFGLQVFTCDGIGLAIAELSDEKANSDPINYGEPTHTDADLNVLRFKHRCSHYKHGHKRMLPHFFVKVANFHFQRSMLTVPKPFVTMYDLHTFQKAKLHFGHLEFLVKIVRRPDCRDLEDETHIVMQVDWHELSQQTGILPGKILRFQLNVKQCIDKQLLDFDVC